jgi:hypothetical protein
VYSLYADNWGKIEAFTKGDWRAFLLILHSLILTPALVVLAADPIIAGIMSGAVQSFFAWRIRVISGSRLLSLAIYATAFVSTCGGIGTGIGLLWVLTYTRYSELHQIAIIWLLPGALCDIAISVSLTYSLRKRKGGISSTNKILDRIIRRECGRRRCATFPPGC